MSVGLVVPCVARYSLLAAASSAEGGIGVDLVGMAARGARNDSRVGMTCGVRKVCTRTLSLDACLEHQVYRYWTLYTVLCLKQKRKVVIQKAPSPSRRLIRMLFRISMLAGNDLK